ncbi:MAG: DUF4479 and tRNA-binding domain-containing protein [Lactobacillaceae bacterium]|jgi:tRNA-binding protein|nr:DUF4479 and tRNA-binding domain-containing protein [Lactobacillaceae bacterium]
MTVYSYNLKTLFIYLNDPINKKIKVYQTSDNITRISDEKDITIAYNFVGLNIPKNGPVNLEKEQIEKLNNSLKLAGFNDTLEFNPLPKFIIGHIESLDKHPDSDHLNIAKVNIGSKKIQIVSGSPNIQNDINVVVALPGAVMPNGQMIFEGQLRGVDSYGMMTSPRELKLKNAPTVPGMLILPDGFGSVGEEFDFQKGDLIFQ